MIKNANTTETAQPIATHTPGPWYVVRGNHRLRIHQEYSPGKPCGNGLHHLEIWEPKTGAGRGCSPTWLGFTPQQEADGALISAAPELLSALRQALQHVPGNAVNIDKALTGPIDRAYTRAICEAAIAKAEGRT